MGSHQCDRMLLNNNKMTQVAYIVIHLFDCSLHVGKEREMIVMRGHSGAIYGTKFTADNNFMLSASEDTTGYSKR